MSPDEVRTLHVYQLADLAGCKGPESDESDGAGLLRDVRDGVLEEFTALVDEHGLAGVRLSDLINECDRNEVSAPGLSTRGMWFAFADLRAYEGDLSEYQGKVVLTDIAVHMLTLITDALVHRLASGLCSWAEDQDDNDAPAT
jgi:hypothetical protein